MSQRITLTGEELDVLDDALGYYALAGYGYGEGDPNNEEDGPEKMAAFQRVQTKVERARGKERV